MSNGQKNVPILSESQKGGKKRKKTKKLLLSPRLKHNLSRTQKPEHNVKGNRELGIEYTDEEIKFIREEYPKMCSPYKYVPAIMNAKKRVIVFGDIHGDYQLAIDMFTKAGLISHHGNDEFTWIGGEACVVQIGDQIDRCRPIPGMPCTHPKTTHNDEANDIKIMELFNSLSLQADKIGGSVISLLGNHELLNAMGQMHYVSYQGLKQFENYVDPDSPDRQFHNGTEARIHAFQPGKNYGKMMGCTRLPAVIIGSNIFVHAGIIDALIEEINLKGIDDFERINIKLRRWLLGLLDQDYVEHIIKYSKTSMFWSRILGKIPPGISLNHPDCMDNIKNVLNLFQIGSIVIGHTPQSFMYGDDINSTCDNKVWRVDNGSSSAFNNFDQSFKNTGIYTSSRRTQYLEIIDDHNYFVCDGTGCKREIRM